MITLREAAAGLLEGVEAAIEAGDWKVDGACDPNVEIIRLKNALAKPDKEWVGMTEADIYDAMDNKDEFDFARAIEAVLRGKNT